MKGLEVTRRYFFEWGLPYLRNQHSQLVDRLAAGMIGGSDSIGADDEISRDHNWGPGFSVWLMEEDYASFGAALAADLHRAVPDSFEGHGIDECFGSKAKSIRVRSMDEFFTDETSGFTQPPSDVLLWNPSHRDESHLYFMKHGQVFHDPLGEFTRRRDGFCHWPQHALLQRLANASWQLWHYGEYNFGRVAQRGDPLAVLLCKAEFIHHAMRLCFYLEQDFVPYWKWVSYCFRQIDGVDSLARELDCFSQSTDITEQQRLIESMCAFLCARVVEKGFLSASDNRDAGPLDVSAQLEASRAELTTAA